LAAAWVGCGRFAALQLATLVSPGAYVAASAQLGAGCVIEPMAVIHAGCAFLPDGEKVPAGTVFEA
jgi:carbonic anhydrase/acetyltransferase-like protein (isoleucine patch superfamily)